MSIYLVFVDVKLGSLVKRSAGFLPCKAAIFLFVVSILREIL